MNISQRFRELLFSLKKNKSELAKDLDVTPTAISKSIKGSSLPSAKLLMPLGEKLNVSIDWLLFGKGKMFMSDTGSPSDSNQIENGENTEDAYLIEYQKNEIEMLKEMLKGKDELIKGKDEIIKLLKSQKK